MTTTAAVQYGHYYATLGITQTASLDEIRSAYKKLALKWHPDRHSDDKDAAAVKFVEINEAYTTLRRVLPMAITARGKGSHTTSPALKPSDTKGYPCRERPRTRYATVPDTNFPSRSPVAQREEIATGSSNTPPATQSRSGMKLSGTPSTRSTAPRASEDSELHGSSHSRPPRRKPDIEISMSSHRYSTLSSTKSSCLTLSSSRSSHSESTREPDLQGKTSGEKHPRKLRKPPPGSCQAGSSPRSTSGHDADYVYLHHADVPLDPPLQPLTDLPASSVKKDSPDPAVPKQWTFPLDLSMHELYHGTSQKFRISTGDAHHSVKVVIPPGTLPGARVHALPSVIFEIRERPHAYFTRTPTCTHDLFMCVELPWTSDDDIPEGHVAFSGPGGEDLRATLPRGLVEGTEGARISGGGMPKRQGNNVVGYGDLYIRWDFFTPDKCDKSSRSRWDVFKKTMRLGI